MSEKNIIESVQQSLLEHIQNKFNLDKIHLKNIEITLSTDATKQQFGDITTNAAMVLAKVIGKNPREIAANIVDFKHEYIEKAEIAGPGFINLFLTTLAIQKLAQQIYLEKDSFFSGPIIISRNPIGHSQASRKASPDTAGRAGEKHKIRLRICKRKSNGPAAPGPWPRRDYR